MVKSIQIFNDMDSLYRFYQIRKVYEDDSYHTVCYIDDELSDKIMNIAEMIASFYQVEIKDRRDIPGQLLQD